MFGATMCPSSGETTVFMRHLVLVILKQVDRLKFYFNWLYGFIRECLTSDDGR